MKKIICIALFFTIIGLTACQMEDGKNSVKLLEFTEEQQKLLSASAEIGSNMVSYEFVYDGELNGQVYWMEIYKKGELIKSIELNRYVDKDAHETRRIQGYFTENQYGEEDERWAFSIYKDDDFILGGAYFYESFIKTAELPFYEVANVMDSIETAEDKEIILRIGARCDYMETKSSQYYMEDHFDELSDIEIMYVLKCKFFKE